MFDQIISDTFNDVRGGPWIDEIGCADLNGPGARHHEFQRILGRHNAADADHRNGHFPCYLPDHPQGNRFDGRTGQAAGNIFQVRLSGLKINGHAGERIDQRYGIRSGFFHRLRHDCDVRDIGGKFNNHRQMRFSFDPAGHFRRRLRVGTKTQTPFFDIRAGDIYFQSVNPFFPAKFSGNLRIFQIAFAINIGNYGNSVPA